MIVTGVCFACTETDLCKRISPQWTSEFMITTRRDDAETDWAVVVVRCEGCSQLREVLFIGNLQTGVV